jgi:chromosomal replication initiator protein
VTVDTTTHTHRSPDSTTIRRITNDLASRLGPHKYDMWFGRAQMRVDGRNLEVATDSSFVAKWIDSHFTDDLHDAARNALGADADINVHVSDEPRPPARPHHDPASRREIAADVTTHPPHHDERHATPHVLDARHVQTRRRHGHLRRLDEFVVGPSNRLAFAAARRIVEERDAGVSPLFIHGECGLGKTHLLQGICSRAIELTGRSTHVRYVTGEQFTNEYIASIRNNTVDAFRNRIRRLDLLAIDDVHFLSNKVRTQGEFLHTLDAIDLTGAKIVLASDEHPRLIKRFSQALISRFLSGMVVQIDRPDRPTRIAIVRRLAAARDLPMTDPAIEAVASRCVGSIRELEGAVTKLMALRAIADLHPDATGSATGGSEADAVGLVLVERLFQDHGWSPPVPVRLGTIIDAVCDRLGISRHDLMGSSRHRQIVLGRGLVAYLGREMTTHSYPEIARALGRSYHSTIHTAEQRLRRQLADDRPVDLGDRQRPLPVSELVSQLQHEISRATVAA